MKKQKHESQPVRRLSMETMRSIWESHNPADRVEIFMSDDLAMAHSARSLIHTLAVKEPLFMVDSRLGIVRKGHAHYTMDLMSVDICEGDVIYISKGSVLQLGEMSPDYDLSGVAFDDGRLNFAFNGRPPMLFQQYACHRVLHASAQELDAFSQGLELLWKVSQLPFDVGRTSNMCLGPLLSLFEVCLNRQDESHPVHVSHKQELFNSFLQLVNSHVQKAHSMDYYARELCLTPRYLGTIVKQVSGETGKTWIDKALVMKAKIMLRHTDSQVSQVADLLGFPTSSFFCRFFKEHTGQTPQDYRAG